MRGGPDICSFFNSFTLSAYLKVFRVCSQHELAGETLAIIVVLLFPVKESFRTYVNLLPLKGRCFFSMSRALMHSFRAKRDLLISAPSILVCLFWSIVSAPLSLPAKSMKLIFPYALISLLAFSWSWRIAWDLDESALAPVTPDVLDWRPDPMTVII